MCVATLLGSTAVLVEAAPVFCRKGTRLKVREDACKPRETVLDLSGLGAVGAAGPTGPAGPAGLGLRSPLVVPAAAFSDDGATAGNGIYVFASGQVLGGGVGYCIKAPVVLPGGSTIIAVRGFLFDNDAGNATNVQLRRVANTGGTSEVLANVATSAESAGIQEVVDGSVVNGQVSSDYAYALTACLGSSSTRIQSVHIEFTPPATS